ncbi:NADH-ubiquinone oxidoreductase-F iron-sulfur binding region domain-containing protein [Carboxydochorda subterranea]|uniref:NADH-ubiquinone oxidoreductase-F iron-sulfur binding region domain-containing protein n=1 Tax=Carboxydichorda subterranea TaxID=3109565 RepID=A0ABZ1BX30_9FIRM|nr:NADH-ubiquinone oxidoreductase-F iron-sulfur binding region domain-containing protein [Limnochorda sp. L945t]WRP17337.1 NADH-ubiquinone oxidoreductase-F iron-sulfur binding region domain-containing protein [Limnochorda sp. L945t]
MVTRELLLARRGRINPDSFADYRAAGGYRALEEWLTRRTPEAFIEELKRSGLKGRGGAWFPTGLKLEMARGSESPRFMVCNADEGEPGTCKDRVLLEEDPHSVLEGLILAAWAVGSHRGILYLRGEYAHLAPRLEHALRQAEQAHLLGDDILGTGYSLHVELYLGAGAYVCGEETALLNSVEGLRGEPRLRPPYPTQRGLFGWPTVVNNVETLANLPVIAAYGGEWFRHIGHPDCPGTKLFSLVGDVKRPGVVEAPIGVSLEQLIEEAAGGVSGPWPVKWVQIGGACGGVLGKGRLPIDWHGVTLDPQALKALGAGLGTGSVLVCDSTRCPVDVARSLARFFARESCGYCTPCREGSLQILRALDRLATGIGRRQDVDNLDVLTRVMQAASRCALGQSAPVGLRGLLTHFRDEIEAHLLGRCPSGSCPMAEKPAGRDRTGAVAARHVAAAVRGGRAET